MIKMAVDPVCHRSYRGQQLHDAPVILDCALAKDASPNNRCKCFASCDIDFCVDVSADSSSSELSPDWNAHWKGMLVSVIVSNAVVPVLRRLQC